MQVDLSDLEKDRLEKYLYFKSRNIHLEREYWLSGSDDEGVSYCYDCAVKEIKKINDPDITLGGGYDVFINDSGPYCDTCDQILETLLTECGINDDIDHYSECELNPYSEYDCLSFLTMVESADWRQESFKEMQGWGRLLELCRDVLDKHFWIMPYEALRHMWQ